MAFSRREVAETPLTGPELDAAMVGIGMVFSAKPNHQANIEDTVLEASLLGMGGDFRVLSVLVTWLGVHHERLNADRLVKLVQSQSGSRVLGFWVAIAQWLHTDRRLSRLLKLKSRRQDLLPVGTDFQLQRRGEDPRFAESTLRVPAGVLRDREQDVLSPQLLAARHPAYKHRVLIGPSYRADMWAALTITPALSASELARRTYGSFATAWQVKRDFELLVGNADTKRKAS